MIKDSELETFLNDLESDRIERKESISDGDRIRQAICAFANDLPDYKAPGIIFVGVNDAGTPTGMAITDQLLLTLANMRSDGNILPMPTMLVQKRILLGREVAVVIVYSSDAPPVRCKGVTWIRVGPRRAFASAQEERRLSEKRRSRDLPFDIHPADSLVIDALDRRLFQEVYLPSAVDPEVIVQNQRSLEDQMLALRFAHPGPPVHPTVLGLLVVGLSPADYLPGAYIQFLRIDGAGLADPIKSSRELRGPLVQLLPELDELLKINVSTKSDVTSGTLEIRRADYPIVALQQLVRNAIMHRSYESTHAPIRISWFNDRVEIQNPGGPFGQVNRQNFGLPGATDYRNPHLAEAMKALGYVQRFGIGIALARHEMSRNGNPPPEFSVEDAHVAVILRRQP